MREWLAPWDDFTIEAEDFLQRGNRVVVPFLVRGRGSGSGVEVKRRWAHAWTFAGGRVVRFEVFLSVADALAAG
jgi:ketosteroid isomerase-like protein